MRRRRGEDNIKIVLIAMGFALWTGWFWLRIWTSGVFQHAFHKCLGFISWPAEWHSAFQEGLCSLKLVIIISCRFTSVFTVIALYRPWFILLSNSRKQKWEDAINS
jgi:hypothetical protein